MKCALNRSSARTGFLLSGYTSVKEVSGGITVFGAHFCLFIAFHIADLQGFCYNIFYSIHLADNVFTALNRLFSENVTRG